MDEIGLFPLGIVLLPTEVVPLHVFEDRYKELVGECLELGREFGVVYADEDGVRETGTRARVAEVLERGRERGLIRFDDLKSVVQTIHMMCSGWATRANYLNNTSKETYWREIAAMIEGRFAAPENNSHARAHGPAQGEN